MKRVVRGIGIGLAIFLLLAAVVPFLIPVPALENTRPVAELADEESRFIEVDGITVHYKEFGEGDRTIILLHGFGASTFSWREVTGPLSQSFRVIAYDRPAFGLTERPMPGDWTGRSPYSTASQAQMIIDMMDQLGVNQAVLVGNSAGGTVATTAALAYPERVSALVLVDAAVYTSGGVPSWLNPLLSLPQVDHLGPLLVRSIARKGDDFLRSAWHDPALLSEAVYAGYHLPLQAENWDRGLWELTKTYQANDLPVQLKNLTMPVLVITGDDDRIIPTADSLRLAQEIPGAQLAVMPACGHVPQEECPQDFLDAVIPFLASLQN